MPPKPIIAPSVLASDLSRLSEEAKRMLDEGCDWLHLDVMDGHFVPNLSIGPPVISSLRAHHPSAFFDVHVMASSPSDWISPLSAASVNQVTFHFEAVGGSEAAAAELMQQIRSKGMRAGLALKPGTDLQQVERLLQQHPPDLLLLMTVEPGFGGQKFIASVTDKIRRARKLCPDLDIQVDGGLDAETVKDAAGSGANVIVAGTSLYKSESPRVLMEYMRDVIVASQDAF